MKLFTKTRDKNLNTNRRSGGGNFSCRHPKLWSYIKSNVKAFFVTGAITFVVSASATTILHSRQVRYKNDKSVEQAINELYEKAEQCYGYHVGDEIQVNGIDFYVIADSSATQDYVVALKAIPLTVDEVNLYGSSIPVSAQNFSGYGGMAYGSSSDYSISNIKIIVDAWEDDMFKQGELKSVNNHSVRLITKDEYMNLDVYNWRYSNKYWYWTMTAFSSTAIWMVYKDGSVQNPQSWVNIGSVRPVINVYKSAVTRVSNN